MKRRPDLKAGSILAFPIRPGVYSCCELLEPEVDPRLVGRRAHGWFIVLLDGFWTSVPNLADLQTRKMLASRKTLVDYEKGVVSGDPGPDFVHLGVAGSTESERGIVGMPYTLFQTWERVAETALLEWRRVHDRDALENEFEVSRQRGEEERLAKEERRAKRVARLTLPALAKSRPFASWKRLWGAKVVEAARDHYHALIESLMSAVQHADDSLCRKAIRDFTQMMNALNARTYCIETEEREEIFARLEEAAALVGLSDEIEELTSQREW